MRNLPYVTSNPRKVRMVTVGRVNAQVDGHRRDSFIRSGESVRLGLDLQTNLVKVHKLTALTVQELRIF